MVIKVSLVGTLLAAMGVSIALGQTTEEQRTPASTSMERKLIPRQDLLAPLTEPPCSYCSTQHRKRLIDETDLVLAWIRGPHNGGAIPVRHFLAGPRVINDTYGLFFYDPDGGYVAAYKKDYGFKFHGWRGGAMVVAGPDGTLWSALTGIAFSGSQKGKRLTRIPSLTTQWGHWLMLHPESTAYDLFDGKTYKVTTLPQGMAPEAQASLGSVDTRLTVKSLVLGVEVGAETAAFAIDEKLERDCQMGQVGGKSIAAFWYAPTRSSAAYVADLDGQPLTFYADGISPETAPFKDKQTGTRWTLAGRGVDGPLKGKELTWVSGIQCFWFAWSGEYPSTTIVAKNK